MSARGVRTRPTRRDPGEAERRLVRRRRMVCLAIALCIAGILGLDAALRASAPDVMAEAVSLPAERGTSAGQGSLEALPEGFEAEALPLDGRDEVRIDATGCVIGFSMADAPEAAFASLTRELEGRGWTPVASGMDAAGSFIKKEGKMTWLFVSCTGVAGQTSAVVQCAPEGKSSGQGGAS